MRPQRGNATAPPAPSGAWPTYRRLLGYLRPHRAMFLLGVLGYTKLETRPATVAYIFRAVDMSTSAPEPVRPKPASIRAAKSDILRGH